MFDITNRATYDDIKNQWLGEIRQHTSPSIVIYLIGNFSDLDENREVPYQEALEFARAQQFSHYIETSAKTGQNVHEVFQTLTKQFYLLNEDNLDRFVSVASLNTVNNYCFFYQEDKDEEVSERGSSFIKLSQAQPAEQRLEAEKKGKCCGGSKKKK